MFRRSRLGTFTALAQVVCLLDKLIDISLPFYHFFALIADNLPTPMHLACKKTEVGRAGLCNLKLARVGVGNLVHKQELQCFGRSDHVFTCLDLRLQAFLLDFVFELLDARGQGPILHFSHIYGNFLFLRQ